ncbi:LysM domain receptor-like kinase 3 [Citrus sinensis]|nr:LysM domain receptor-like kinase 3 [Citrus sinensis]
MDYTVLNGDTWEKVSSKFGSFLVEKPDKSLIPSHVVTLDLVCGCSESNDLVTYKVEAGDTLFTICSRFKADVDMTGKLNGLDNPDLIHAGDFIISFPDPVVSTVKKSSKSRIHTTVGILLAAFTITLFTVAFVFWRRSDKATMFSYNEVRDATSNFSTSLKIGQGSYGSVYLGKLRGKIELIGYAAGGDSLFLVYEYAQNGALSDHLHWPSVKGKKPLAWTTRVQIALDAAKGLEYIHQYTKPYYVHRDVKTSNILLDSNFRAKIADFGLVKLLEHSPEIAAAASRIVGTFGYLAPEYVRDGCVTTKSDVYAFGVVLMELITGQQALSRDANPGNNQYTEHRSLVDYMLAVFNDTKDFMAKLTECLDPNLTRYHKDSMLQMALLSKDCVDENWKRRPDMSNAAIRLSHILISSKEWEKMECCRNL